MNGQQALIEIYSNGFTEINAPEDPEDGITTAMTKWSEMVRYYFIIISVSNIAKMEKKRMSA
ncbi:MAG: hypothetical protein EOP45_05410 [Sphingobacteriaceae bacterium]|nr:MAG: hypothetical protein EOP45_05410 [Sphingobacteriaceae bacterium]